MSDARKERPEAENNAGALLSPVGPIPFSGDTRSDELDHAPPEPDDPAQPAPEPRHRSTMDKLVGRNAPPPMDR